MPLVCPNCPVSNIVHNPEEGDSVCSRCGEVVEQQAIDTRSEWRTFANDSAEKGRVGGADNQYVSAMGTTVRSTGFEDSAIAGLSSRASQLKGQDKRVVEAHRYISTICNRLHLTKGVTDAAKELAFLVEERKMFPTGRSLAARAAACVFAATRIEQCARTFKEIYAAADRKATRKDIQRIFKIMNAANPPLWDKERVRVISATDLVSRYCDYSSVPEELKRDISRIASRAKDLFGTRGHTPSTEAAAVILYVAERKFGGNFVPDTGGGVDARTLAERLEHASGIRVSTMREAAKALYDMDSALFPPASESQNHRSAASASSSSSAASDPSSGSSSSSVAAAPANA